MRRIASLLTLAFLLVACGASKEAATSGGTRPAVTADRIVVTALSHPVSAFSAYDLVRRHKANWLKKRGRSFLRNPVPVKVYLDNTGAPYGTVGSLKEIDATDVATIEYFSPQEAHFEFGLGNTSGAILVRTRTGSE